VPWIQTRACRSCARFRLLRLNPGRLGCCSEASKYCCGLIRPRGRTRFRSRFRPDNPFRMVCASCRSPSHRTGSSERAYCKPGECWFRVCAKSAKQQDDRVRNGRKPGESRTSHRPASSFACPQHQVHPLPRHAGTEGPQSQISCPLMRSAMRRRNRPRRERMSPMRCMSPYSTVQCVHDHPIDGVQLRSHVGRPAGDAAPTSRRLSRVRLSWETSGAFGGRSGLLLSVAIRPRAWQRRRRWRFTGQHAKTTMLAPALACRRTRIPTRRSLTAQLRASTEFCEYRSNRHSQSTGSLVYLPHKRAM
jgi:hypothetical protein